jgi:hypothetical protein
MQEREEQIQMSKKKKEALRSNLDPMHILRIISFITPNTTFRNRFRTFIFICTSPLHLLCFIPIKPPHFSNVRSANFHRAMKILPDHENHQATFKVNESVAFSYPILEDVSFLTTSSSSIQAEYCNSKRERVQRFGGLIPIYGDSSLATLEKMHLVVVGVGGVGSWTAEALVRSGVGSITLVDMDEICVSNSNR